MESKNLKPRILAAMKTIGEPATAREIADIGMIDEPIHARLKEMVAHGDLIRIETPEKPLKPLLYVLPTMASDDQPNANGAEMEPAEGTMTDTPPTMPKRPDYSDIYLVVETQKRNMDSAIIDYVSRVFDGDPVYRSMIEARAKLEEVLYEMNVGGMK